MPEDSQTRRQARAPAAQRRTENISGAGWVVFSGLAATAMTISVRELAGAMDSRMIAFLRCSLGLLVVAPLLLNGGWRQLRMTRPWLHALRGVLMGVSLNLGYYALSTLPMTTATILFFLAPVFATALAGPMLAEAVGPRRWAAVGCGFLGAVIILRPGFAALELGMVAAIVGSCSFAVSLMIARIAGGEDGARSLFVSSTVVASLVTLPLAMPVWAPPQSAGLWIWTGAMVIASSIRMYADIRAYSQGEAGFLAPFAYLRLLFVAAAGWLLYREGLDGWTLTGGAVIIAATFYIAHREHRLSKRIAGPAA